jgi:hypothetical protein
MKLFNFFMLSLTIILIISLAYCIFTKFWGGVISSGFFLIIIIGLWLYSTKQFTKKERD